MSQVYIDVAQFLADPIRTGVQRVVRELVRHWPLDIDLVPVEHAATAGGLVHVDPGPFDLAMEYDQNPYLDALSLRQEMAQRSKDRPVRLDNESIILVPELFYDKGRCIFYDRLSRAGHNTHFIVYDFLPWIYPGRLNVKQTAPLNYYLLAAFGCKARCFISEAVRRQFVERVGRRSGPKDVAIALGSNGLSLPRGAALGDPVGNYFLCFGAFDGRKGQHTVLEAFLASKASATQHLVFAGRVSDHRPAILAPVFDCRHPNVSIVDDPGNAELAELVAGARAVVFASELEGYGLPAPEALYVGTPLIASAGLPAISELPEFGQIRLSQIDVAGLAAAFDQLVDDSRVRELKYATAGLHLPNWADYGRRIADWVMIPA